MDNLDELYSLLSANKKSIHFFISNTERCYKLKVQPKMKFGRHQEDNGAVKLRYLLIPRYQLKSIQQQICYQFRRNKLPDCMFGSLQGSSNILNALQHLDGKFFLTIDLKNFFSNITNNQVHKIFCEAGCSLEAARIFTKLTTYKGSLPQGAPSSPALANQAFANTARQIEEFIKKYKITFTIFLDDLTFSSSKDFKFLIPGILKIINANHFYPHHKKIHYRKNFCEITGLIVGNRELKLVSEMEAEALINPKVNAYAMKVRREYDDYLKLKKNSNRAVHNSERAYGQEKNDEMIFYN